MAFVRILVTGDATTEVSAADPLTLAGDVTVSGASKSLTANDFRVGAETTLTIATGDVTITGSYHTIAGEGAASDQLDGMSAGGDGQLLFIRPDVDTEDITVAHNQNPATDNNIFTTNTESNIMDNDDDFMMFIYDATLDTNGVWLEVCRSTGTVASLTGSAPANVGTAAAVGAATDAARANHVHDTDAGFIDLADKFAAGVIDNPALADNAVDTEEINTNAVGADAIDTLANDIAFNQVLLTPISDGVGTTVGTIYYDLEDDALFVFVA